MSKTRSVILAQLSHLYIKVYANEPHEIISLPQSGSPRQYFRLSDKEGSVIGVYSPDIAENRTFITFTNHFLQKGLNTPAILAISDCLEFYLITDLGDVSLYSILSKVENENGYSEKMVDLLKSSLTHLVKFQTDGFIGFDPAWCYPKSIFDQRAVMWDLNYFKYSFLKTSGIVFNEDKLEDDFEEFSKYLVNDDMHFFHYRDFQSRNIMVKNDELFFIDYQGGRLGPCLYDVASFLYQARASIPEELKASLFLFYLTELGKKSEIDKSKLADRFPAFILFRIIQTIGAYGFRGYFEKKPHFLLSIPLALKNLQNLLAKHRFDFNISYLIELLNELIVKYQQPATQLAADVLTIDLVSFSFLKGYPEPNPHHGGGFIFDCRSLPNPGRVPELKRFTGLDQDIIEFFEKEAEVQAFIDRTYKIIVDAASNYKSRNFNYLSVGFGCTGGQHRSVYCSAKIAEMLAKLEGIRIVLKHRELIS